MPNNTCFLAKVLFYVVNAFEDKSYEIMVRHPYMLTVVLMLPVVFLSMAIVINLRNW